MDQSLSFGATIRLWNNGKQPASWHFVTVSKEVSDTIKKLTKDQPRKGRGSVKVSVRVGFATRQTSVFPDKKSGCYVLPIKASVRKELEVGEGDDIMINLELL